MSNGFSYVLNSAYSDTYLTIGATNNTTCVGYVVGDMQNVCSYYTNVPPQTWVKFPSNFGSGLFAQANGSAGLWGTWALNTCQITANIATGQLCIQPWSGPAPLAAAPEADRPKQATTGRKKPPKAGAGPSAPAG
ncbi:MAG TPA: hypothetical protein VF006_25615 [Longimicrobium sp.]